MGLTENIAACHLCPKRGPVEAPHCRCLMDGADILDHAADGYCPLGRYVDAAAAPKKPAKRSIENAAEWGPPLWTWIHSWAIDFRGPPEERDAWIGAFGRNLPCGECRTFWNGWLLAHPPPDDPARMFGWSVDGHNAVNVKLGRLEVTEAEARAIWTQ